MHRSYFFGAKSVKTEHLSTCLSPESSQAFQTQKAAARKDKRERKEEQKKLAASVQKLCRVSLNPVLCVNKCSF